MISNALDVNLISRIVGYNLAKGVFNTTSPNLPQVISIFGEANTANQTGLSTNPRQITSAVEAGQYYGYGSPIYNVARILFPINGGGVSIPVKVYPQAAAGASVAAVRVITPTGTATKNGTHTLIINGRSGLDGVYYNVNILTGDTPTVISGKIRDAVNAVLGAPAIGAVVTTTCELTAKWTGLTSDGLNVSIDTGNDTLGVTYAVTAPTAGSGTPSVTASLALIGSAWEPIIINCYGTHAQTCAAFESWNGKAENPTPTGRYAGDVWKPAHVLTGSVADNEATFTDAKLDEMTIAICPCPLSLGWQFEAAANWAVLHGNNASNTPAQDIEGRSLPDMPTPTVIGTMAVYANRQVYVLKGCSTVDLVSGRYQVQDFVTTYHKLGEVPAQFRYVRNGVVDFNIRYSYLLKEIVNVKDHILADDTSPVNVDNVVKPKQWKAIMIGELIPDLAKRGLISEPAFSIASVQVGISNVNPDRFETAWSYKRTGVARVIATTVKAGFYFGTN